MANSARGSGSTALPNSPLVEADEPFEDPNESEFRGATLSIISDYDQNQLSATSTTIISATPESDNNANLRNENSNIEMASTKYQRSHSQLSADNEEAVKNYFASGAFGDAVKNCRPVILENIDGHFHDAWLLTEIDHWDNEKERLIFLLDKSIIIIKYDFITLKILNYRRIQLQELDQVSYGQITYPEKSLMPPKNAVGVRLLWNKGQPLELSKSWNPWSRQIPYTTFTAHRLHYNEAQTDAEMKIYDIESFKQQLLQAIQSLAEAQHCILKEEVIVIENYVGLVSAVHNFTDLGFFKARGRVSF